jgi:hypothetical protein
MEIKTENEISFSVFARFCYRSPYAGFIKSAAGFKHDIAGRQQGNIFLFCEFNSLI